MGDRTVGGLVAIVLLTIAPVLGAQDVTQPGRLLTGKAAMGDWTSDAPGVRRKITVADLPSPSSNVLAINPPRMVARPADAHLNAPPRLQDRHVGERVSRSTISANRAKRRHFRRRESSGSNQSDSRRARRHGRAFCRSGLEQTIWNCVLSAGRGSAISLCRKYRRSDSLSLSERRSESARPRRKTKSPTFWRCRIFAERRHWTRDIVFSPDGKKMYVSIGSRSNNSDDASEANRARIFEFNPDGTDQNVYAWGIRNAVGIAFRPGTNELWMSTNERDELGDDLPPDYISSVKPDGFYGWPWFYIGNHVDPHHKGQHVDLASKVIVPDVLVQAHSATLNLCFYTGEQFPAEYKGDIFAAFHGSWNRTRRTGYKIVRVPFDHATGKVLGEYEDFVTGFVTRDGRVWGRPVGITVAKDGALLFSEDGNGTIWRVSHGQ